MGKEKSEFSCIENLLSNKGGKYMSKKLKKIRCANRLIDFTESPDFAFENEDEIFGIEHFIVDLLYKDNCGVLRSGSRLSEEALWDIYGRNHKELEEGQFDAKKAGKEIEGTVQKIIDLVASFDYKQYISEFERIVNKHGRKIEQYYSNLKHKDKTKLFFLIEERVPQIERYSSIINCVAYRRDGARVMYPIYCPIITEDMLKVIKQYIGCIEGIIIQVYKISDLMNHMTSMIYLDVTDEANLYKSLREQKVDVFNGFEINAPGFQFTLEIE